MIKFLFKLWPAFVPIVLFLVWRKWRKFKGAEEKLSLKESQLWTGTLILSLLIAIGCIIIIAVSQDNARYPNNTMPSPQSLPQGEQP